MERIFKSPKLLPWLFRTALIILFIVFALSLALLVFEARASQTGSYDLQRLANWGAVLGGVLSPIFAFLAFIGLLGTISIQQSELKQTRKELKGSKKASRKLAKAANQQNIENAFFQLINLHQSNLQTITVGRVSTCEGGKRIPCFGSRAFEEMSSQIFKGIIYRCSDQTYNPALDGYFDEWGPFGWPDVKQKYPSEKSAYQSLLVDNYLGIYELNQADLGKYFRLLHNTLKFLHEKKRTIPSDLITTYSKILRASLSDFELFIIMANCLTEAGSPIKEYVAEFELFDNFPKTILKMTATDERANDMYYLNFSELWSEFDAKSFGDNPDYRAMDFGDKQSVL